MSGPLPDLLTPLTIPASWVYERIIEARNRRYDRGAGVEKLLVPVISVGNITTGGSGKTPMVMWLARLLCERGHRPAIAMRGYAPGRLTGSLAGTGGRSELRSDEAIEYSERLPHLRLIVHPDRVSSSREHLASHDETDCIVLDDGFQHRRLHRDLDLVLIDAAAETFTQRLIPAGHLREPLPNLARADAVIVTRAPCEWGGDEQSQISNLKAQIERHHGGPPLAWTRHRWTHLRVISKPDSREAEARGSDRDSFTESRQPPEFLRGKRLVTLLGVGNPQSIIAQLEAAGAIVAADIPAGDHERFTRAKLEVARGLCDGLGDQGGLVMTHKDWVRARDVIDLRRWPVPIIIPHVELEFLQGRNELEQLVLSAVKPLAA